LERDFILSNKPRHAIELLDSAPVSPRYPAGKVALLMLENGLECIHDRASARVIPFGLLDASAVIVRTIRNRALPAIILV
jgi:hypothetical protein